jgi:hypothetical protein
VKLFYVGDDIYHKSGTMMSVLYHETPIMSMSPELNGEYYGSDWGKVNCALRNGETVTIRPATVSELFWVYKKLAEYLSSK